MSLDSHLLSMKTLFDPSRAPEHADVQLRLGDEVIRVRIRSDEIGIARETVAEPQLVVETDASHPDSVTGEP